MANKINEDARRAIQEFYTTPIKLGEDGLEIDARLTSLGRVEAETLAALVTQFKPKETLEIGLALGSSAIAIAASKVGYGLDAPHIALDPFQKKRARNAGILEIKRVGLEKSVTHHSRFSEDFLNQCFQDGKRFDFIFIDGYHGIGQTATDAFLSDKILNPNGVIAFHDSLMWSTAMSVMYLMKELNYQVVSKSGGVKPYLRMIKYFNKLGPWYASRVIPRINMSIVALQKPSK